MVFTSFDEKYKLLGVSLISSIWENTPNDLVVSILDLGLKKKTKKIILTWAQKKNRLIHFFKVESSTYYNFFGNSIILPQNLEYYSRLLIPHLSFNFDKVLYLDADIICTKNFMSIFNIELGENIIAAVQDSNFSYFSSRINKNRPNFIIDNFKDLGFHGKEKYFNSGVLLINTKKWISDGVSKKILDISFKYESKIFLWDQYALNVYFANRWTVLSNEWNETNSIDNSKTIFRHFTKVKPISYKYDYSDLSFFYKYLDKTPWSKWRPNKYLEKYLYIFLKIKNKIILRFKIYLKIIS